MKLKCKMPIRLGHISINMIFPIFYTISNLLLEYIPPLFDKVGNLNCCPKPKDYDNIRNNSHIGSLFLFALTKAILGSIGITISYLMRRKDDANKRRSKITYSKLTIITNPAKDNRKKYFFWICGLGLLEIIKTLMFTISTQNFRKFYYISSIVRFTKMLIFPILNLYFFKEPIYKHHKLSVGIIVIGLALDMSLGFTINQSKWQDIYLMSPFPYVFELVQLFFEKWILHFKYLCIYYIMFVEGLFGVFVSSLLLVVCYTLPLEPLFSEINIQLFTEVLPCNPKLLIARLFHALFLVFKYLTNQSYSPTVLILNDLLMIIYPSIKNFCTYEMYYGFILITIGILIYNEIVVIDVCHLAENSKEKIISRSDMDIVETIDEEILTESEKEPYLDDTLNSSVNVNLLEGVKEQKIKADYF